MVFGVALSVSRTFFFVENTGTLHFLKLAHPFLAKRNCGHLIKDPHFSIVALTVTL